MRALTSLETLPTKRLNPDSAMKVSKNRWAGGNFAWLCFCISLLPMLVSGCGHFNEALQAKPIFEQANVLFNQGNYSAALTTYAQITEKYPATGDRVLFEMGIIHAHPQNEQKDYQQSLESFQKLIRDYPESGYRQDSEMMVFYINNVLIKDQTIALQQKKIEDLQQDVKAKGHELSALKNELDELNRKFFDLALQYAKADKILVEKAERRLTLFFNDQVLKTYKIALGGNPIGPKEQQGDNKTPEGVYFIDAKNKDSQYHLSLHISYPNASDRQRAQELGVSPGGDIMIHGIKNGFSWVGGFHSEVDWTKGCIAVTDEEIEEIDKLAPIGTIVEIKP